MNIFFIIGAQKSGTTWLQRSLNSVEGVSCLGEGHFVDRLVLPIAETIKQYNQLMHLVDETVYEGNGYYKNIETEEFLGVMKNWILERLLKNSKKESSQIIAVGDKTPANSFHVRSLRQLFPECKFVHMLRDGRDVAVSAYYHKSRLLNDRKNVEPKSALDNELADQVHKWGEFTRAALKAEQENFPVHTIRYEEMLLNPDRVLKDCLEFIAPNTLWEEQAIANAVEANSFKKQSGRDRGEICNSSFLRQGVSGSWKQETSQEALAKINPTDKKLLQQLGYINQ